MRKILIVDDETELCDITADMLRSYGYEVTCVYNSAKAYERLEQEKFHLIVLDINLPDVSGFEICKELRTLTKIPVIFASARSCVNDKVVGFESGGDDYITKPYALKELLVRIQALIRRTYPDEENMPVYSFGQITIDTGKRLVTKGGNEVRLSLKEYDVLQYLFEHRNQILSKETILNHVWNLYAQTEISTVSVHIRWLREKLEDDASNPKYIKTVWGKGYRLEVSQEEV